MATKIIPISDLRRKTSEVIKTVQKGDDVVYITQHGRPAAVLLNYDRFEMLMLQVREMSVQTDSQAPGDEPDSSREGLLPGLLDNLPSESLMMVEQLIRFLRKQSERPSAAPEQRRFRYPAIPLPASSLDAWMDLLPEGYEGDALADTEALYDAV